ncbi:HRDC domain-containing protein [Deinococcus piscis]|nr:HRDC domain-containing protein [Deinococcus piscis]
MTNFDSDTAAQRGSPSELRPDARLIALHSERGDAHSRLESALAALEGADWGMTLAGEAALAQQLRALLGAGVLRLDPRLPLRRDLLAEAGLAAAGLEGDWRGAVALWLLEPGEDDLQRAERAGVPVIVDAALAPGAHWLAAGAQYVTYHHGAALTGFADGELALLFGSGRRPVPAAPAAADLTAALALRDVATLPLRLARAAQTAASLASQLAGRALPVGPTALLLPPEAAAATAAPLGGVLPAARPVQGGVILTPGLADTRQVRSLLRGEQERLPAQATERQTARAIERTDERPQGSGAERVAEHRAQDHRTPAAAELPTPSGQERGPSSQAAERPETTERAESRQGSRHFQRTERVREDRVHPDQGKRHQPQRPQSSERPQSTAQGPQHPETPAGRSGGLERVVFEAPRTTTSGDNPNTENLGELPASNKGHGDKSHSDRGRPEPRQPSDHRQDRRNRNGSQESAERAEAHQGSAEPRPEQPQQPTQTAAAPSSPVTEPLQPDLPTAAQPGGAKPDPAADLTEEQSAVFARLRDWRNAEASRQEISRFIVASNATLAEIARRVPYTVEDLQTIKGMGPARLSKYGEAIVQVVRGTRG